METDLESRLEAALKGSAPFEGLLEVACDLKRQGLGQKEVYLRFQDLMLRLRAARRGEDEDRVLEIMDVIVGFCPSSARLFPDDPYDPDLGTS